MKKLFFALFVLAVSFNTVAQEDQSFEEKAIHLISMTSGQQFDVIAEPLVQMVPAAKQEDFKKELKQSMESLYKKMAVVYMENYTEEELNEILAFYDTPVGKKMVATTPEVTQKAMQIGQVWAMELQPLMTKYMN